MCNTTKKNLIILFLSTFLWIVAGGAANAQTSDTYMRMAPAPGMNGGLSLAETSDGGFVGTGQQQAGSSGGCDVYVFKVDACGSLQWEKLYGGAADDGGKYVQQTSDGGYIVTGIYVNNPPYILLLKLDALGNLQWSKTYNVGYGLFVQQTNDGGYILTGFSSGFGFGGSDIILVKTDGAGNIQWEKVYGGAGEEWGNYVEQTNDGGYVVAGYTGSYGAGSTDLFLLKVDSLGIRQWDKTYGGPGGEGSTSWGISGQATTDGGYMVCGNTASYGAGSNDVLLVKTDSAGNLKWAKTYGGANDDQPRFAHQTRNGGYIICGLTTSFGAGNLDAYMIRTDGSGNLKWSKAYGGPDYDKGQMVREAADGGFALSMITLNFGANYYDPIFMKTDSMGAVGCYETNCATIVNNVNPSVGTGLQEMIPAIVASSPSLSTNNYTPSDVFLCRHCITVPAFVPSDTTVCVGRPMYFYNTTTIGIRCFEDWYVNGTLVNGNKDTLPFVFSTAGTKVIQLVASCGNSTDTNTVRIHVYDFPVASFSNTSVCHGSATQFTDNSTISSGSISLWGWNFGDGSSLNTTQNPSHTYANSGNAPVTLIVSNSFGCADTITKPVKVYYNPVAAFTHSDVCFKDSMHFANTSSVDTSTSIATYLWDFGDGATSNLKNPAHDYSSHGTYSVTLVTTTVDLCSDAATHTVNVFDPPHSAFTFTNTCFANAALFTNTTISPTMGSTASWSWNFGDTSPLNTNVWSPQHLYSIPGNFPGNYQVILITHSSNLGCADTFQTAITMFPMPFAKFGFANVCLHQPMLFHDSSIVSSGSITSWSWNFGDATQINTVQHPSHTYANPGTYVDSLIVTTNNGCKDTVVKSVVLHPLPIVQFSRINECDGTPVPFTDHSSISPTDTIQSWLWNFGDNTHSTSQDTSHHYATAGSYSVQLVVVSTFGCKDSITKTSIVNPNPVVRFKAIDTTGCEPLCVGFKDLSIIATGGIVQWSWNFGDGSPPSHLSDSLHHCYHNNNVFKPDTLTVSLTATSDSGCVSTGYRNDFITVFPNPIAKFNVQPQTTTIIDPVISVIDLSIGTNFWHWNFGDHDTISKHYPTPHTYKDTGTYTIMLITSTKYNCVDTSYQTVTIEPDFVFYIPNSFSPNGDGINDSFTGKGIFIKEYEMSIFDRWGNLIFYTNDINKPWDGTANHGTEIALRDVYVYSINIIDYNRRKHAYKGLVTLVK